jgi:DNA-binding NtrC family response regulator
MAPGQAALLVDDDPNVAAALRPLLASSAVRVDIVADARGALELMETNHYDGLVLDFASSSAVLSHLHDKRIRIPVVVTSTELPAGVASEDIRMLLPKGCPTSLLACTILGLCGIES